MAGKHRTQPEMIQVDRSGTSSPFWKGRLNGAADSRNRDSSSKIVGASYSHADILKLDSLTVRPSTPPSAGSAPASLPGSGGKLPKTGKNFTDFMSQTDDDWVADVDDETTDDFLTGKTAPPKAIGYIPPMQARSSTSLHNALPPTPSSAGPSYPSPKAKGTQTLRSQWQGLIRDPCNSLHLIHHPTFSPETHSAAEIDRNNSRINRINKFKAVLQATTVDLNELRKLAWNGIPEELRPMSWQLLLGYLPTNADRRVLTLERKRKEFLDGVKQAFSRGTAGLDQTIWHQISIDVPRTNPHLPLYSYEAAQRSLEKILYVWAIRHPASGYVQGINDLVTPFFEVFLSAYVDGDVETFDPGVLPQEVLDVVQADSFWCLTKLLDGIQDNYIHTQPGIQRQVNTLRDLVSRIDVPLARHLSENGVEFIQFSFRWMNCMLMRELSVKNTIRMWDTYMAEGAAGFSEFHLYVCAAFLVKWTDQLQKMDFQEIMMFLQALPTQNWGEQEVGILLSEAFLWKSLFHNSTAHLRQGNSQASSGIPFLNL